MKQARLRERKAEGTPNPLARVAARLAAHACGDARLLAQNSPDAGMPPFPALTGPVVDDAHLLPEDVFDQLSQKLAAYSQANGTQLVVVTLPTLNGYPIEYYGYQLGRHWGIGQKGKNNGVLLIVDVGRETDRASRWAMGSKARSRTHRAFLIIHNVIAPHFRSRRLRRRHYRRNRRDPFGAGR